MGNSWWSNSIQRTPTQHRKNQDIIVVHNGIFENYLELKQTLIEKGHQFRSETDSEVFAHLIEENIKLGLDKAFKWPVTWSREDMQFLP